MPKQGAETRDLGAQISAAGAFSSGLEVQQLKASVRARLFGTLEGAPTIGGFTIRRLIGRGGVGAVFEAAGRDGEALALKVLRGLDPAALYRFKLEFRALAEVAHPNLALLHHLVLRGDQAFLTMELVDGVDFLTFVREDPARLRPALAQVVAGLEALHAAGKLHCDIKPTNVMVTREGRVVILDFGLVHELAGATSRELVGTPAYIAPESALGAPPAPAADWYAVGVMLYEALTGRLPFPGAVEALRDKCERDAPPPLGASDPELAALCSRLLARTPEARADGAELARIVGAPPATPPRRGGPTLGLLGRDAAWDDLCEWLRVAARGPAVAVVRGPSGIGKSSLVRAFLEAAQAGALADEPAARVLAGRCHEREQVAHNAFDSVIDALTGLLLGLPAREAAALIPRDIATLARLFPGLRRVAAIAEAYALAPRGEPGAASLREAVDVLRDICSRLAASAPLVLAVDDAQWADADSAGLLVELLRGAGAPRCLVLLVAREEEGEELGRLLAALRREEVAVREVTLAPLRHDQAAGLAELLLRRAPIELDDAALRAAAAAVAAESGGVPLFVRELVHHLRLRRFEGAQAGPPSFDEMIAARLAGLSPVALRLIEAVAVAGRPLEIEVAAEAADAGAGRREVQALRAAHLARAGNSSAGEVIEPYHERIRRVVRARVDAAREQALHGLLAEILLRRPGVPLERIAGHLRAAGDRRRSAELTRLAAGRAVEAMALRRAATLYREAAQLLPAGDREGRRDMLVRSGEVLAAGGHGGEAAECFLLAAAEAPSLVAIALRQRAAEQLLREGEVERGRPLLRQVLAELGAPLPTSPVARALRARRLEVALRWRGRSFVPRAASEIDPEELLRLDALGVARRALLDWDPRSFHTEQQAHLLQCLEVGEPSRIARALAGHAAALSHWGDRDEEAAQALGLARSLQARFGGGGRALIALCGGVAAHNAGDFLGACAELGRTGAEPTTRVTTFLVRARAAWLHSALFHVGDVRGLSAVVEAGAAALRAVGDGAGELRLRANFAVLAALAHDLPAEARRVLAAAERQVSGACEFSRGHAYLAARLVDLYELPGVLASARARAAWPEYVRGHLFRGQFGRVVGSYWRASAGLKAAREGARGAAALALGAAATADALAGEGRGWSRALAHGLRAGAWSLRGRVDAAVCELASAARGFAAANMGLFAAAARWHRGRLLGGSEGAALLGEAIVTMRASGVAAPERMARALLAGLP